MQPTRRTYARVHRILAVAACASLAAAGCGGGGGSGARAIANALAVAFPAAVTLTNGTSVTFRGTADPARVVAVEVDGAIVTTGDGFASWTAVVPIGAASRTAPCARATRRDAWCSRASGGSSSRRRRSRW